MDASLFTSPPSLSCFKTCSMFCSTLGHASMPSSPSGHCSFGCCSSAPLQPAHSGALLIALSLSVSLLLSPFLLASLFPPSSIRLPALHRLLASNAYEMPLQLGLLLLLLLLLKRSIASSSKTGRRRATEPVAALNELSE